MRRNVVLLLMFGLSGVLWIEPFVSAMMHSRPNVVVEKITDQSIDMMEPASAAVFSPFDVIESVTVTSKGQGQTDPSELNAISNAESINRSLEKILKRPLTGESETALMHRLQTWSVTEPAETARWIEQTLSEAPKGSAAEALVYPLLYKWMEIEPEVALVRLGAFADPGEIPYLMLSHAERLAEKNTPLMALEWAESLQDNVSARIVVDGLLQHWLEHDVASLATQLELEHPSLQYGIDAVEGTTLGNKPASTLMTDNFRLLVATALVEEDPARALQWADALGDADAEEVRSKAFNRWLLEDPVAASDWLSDELADTGTIPVSLASSLPQHDISLALNTLPLLSDASHEAMTSAIVKTLSAADPDNARSWVDAVVDPSDRSAAMRIWAITNAERQPSEALYSVLESTSAQQRLDILLGVSAIVVQVDQSLLENWLIAAPLTDYERSQIASVVLDAEVFPFQ